MADKDLFADERIVVSIESTVGSDFGYMEIKRSVSTLVANKILKLMLKNGDKSDKPRKTK